MEDDDDRGLYEDAPVAIMGPEDSASEEVERPATWPEKDAERLREFKALPREERIAKLSGQGKRTVGRVAAIAAVVVAIVATAALGFQPSNDKSAELAAAKAGNAKLSSALRERTGEVKELRSSLQRTRRELRQARKDNARHARLVAKRRAAEKKKAAAKAASAADATASSATTDVAPAPVYTAPAVPSSPSPPAPSSAEGATSGQALDNFHGGGL